MRTACWSSLIVLALTATIAGAAEPPKSELPKFELHDGDRVVFLGNTLIEREQKYGYWELMLTMAWPERNVTFRNLGWSGDTVWGESRAGFGTQADGFKALVNQVNAAKPTVIFVGYGNVEAFDGEAGLPKFIDGYNKLLDVLEATKARIVLLAPLFPESEITFPGPFEIYSRQVRQYAKTIADLAERRGHRFAEWQTFSAQNYDRSLINPYTRGIELLPEGYQSSAMFVQTTLGLPTQNPWTIDAELRDQIIKKNELFFHRWRPQNETYLFGFRKHEQGNNAKDVFAFDPLIEAEEKKIAELRVRFAAEMKEASNAK